MDLKSTPAFTENWIKAFLTLHRAASVSLTHDPPVRNNETPIGAPHCTRVLSGTFTYTERVQGRSGLRSRAGFPCDGYYSSKRLCPSPSLAFPTSVLRRSCTSCPLTCQCLQSALCIPYCTRALKAGNSAPLK